MDIDDLHGIFELLQDAEEKFPDAWRVFFSEWGEPVEARREAFAMLGSSTYKPFGMWSDPIPVTPPI